jgi:DmsE family decaheme c-type cytochrome
VLGGRAALLLAALGAAALAGAAEPTKPKPSERRQPLEYAPDDSCGLCHEDVTKAIGSRLHGAVLARREKLGLSRNCQSCHGPSAKHLDDPAKTKPEWTVSSLGRKASAAMCLQCHDKQIAPLEWQTGNHHAGKVQCWDCHSKDRPATAHSEYIAKPPSSACMECHREVEGIFRLNSHHPVVVEQRIECSDCHKPHGRLRDREITATCRGCHVSMRGPYVFEHGVLSGRLSAGCIECHDPHGSPNRRLLKFNGRALCLQCHAEKVNHFVGPDCWDCHQGWHGSNTSPFLLTP